MILVANTSLWWRYIKNKNVTSSFLCQEEQFLIDVNLIHEFIEQEPILRIRTSSTASCGINTGDTDITESPFNSSELIERLKERFEVICDTNKQFLFLQQAVGYTL